MSGSAERIAEVLREELPNFEEGNRLRTILEPVLSELEVETQLARLDFEAFPKTEAQVKAELKRQADKYIDFGLHRHPARKMAKGKFKDTVVALGDSQPERFAKRFDIPTAVLGYISPKDIYNAAGVDYFLEGLDVGDWKEDPKGYTTPSDFYLTWMHDGARNLKRKVEDVRRTLEVVARGATELDGTGIYVAHPRILEHHYIDFPGTSVGRDDAPSLHLFLGRPELHCSWVDGAPPGFGSALCGRN